MKQKAKTHRASAKRLRITRTGKVKSNKKANASICLRTSHASASSG